MPFFYSIVFKSKYTFRCAELGRVLDFILEITKGSFRFIVAIL